MNEFLSGLAGTDPKATILLVLNIIIMESLLSIDNAAVLASMVMDLPKEQRRKALLYGMIGAIGFRVICLFLASYLLQIWWIEPIGGIYLLLLVINYFAKKKKVELPEHHEEKPKFFSSLTKYITPFVATVFMIQLMDLAFSIDNILAVVAFTKNMSLIVMGVIIGIITMRFVANWFVSLMVKYPFLEKSAYIIIAVLGVKLTLSGITHFYPNMPFVKYLGTGGNITHHVKEKVDQLFSLITLMIFFLPLISSLLFGYPKNFAHKEEHPQPENSNS
jgi:YkoY family integral membrane protein